MTTFQSLSNYSAYIYNLKEQYPSITASTLVLYQRGVQAAMLSGSIQFANGYRLAIRERLSTSLGYVRISRYSYEVWLGDEKVYWYDPQPHPHIPELAENHPHHKHIPPDIKRNRIPAPQLAFDKPNLPFLIEEVLSL